MLNICQNVWFLHIHRSIVQMAKNCKHCTEQGKNLKLIIGKNCSIQKDSIVEPNEEEQLDFAGALPDDLNNDAYILVAIDKWSKFPTVKVVSNTTKDVAINSCNGIFQITEYPIEKNVIKHKHLERKNSNSFVTQIIILSYFSHR